MSSPLPSRAPTLAPGPPGHFLLGNLGAFTRRPLQQMSEWFDSYGDLVRFRLGTHVLHMLSHPRLAQQALIEQPELFVKTYQPEQPRGIALVLGQGLVTSSGDLWKRQRRLIQPLFHRSSVGAMEDEIIGAGERLLERWGRLGDGAVVDVGEEMMRLTLEIITRTMFSTSVLDEVHVLGPALKTALEYAAQSMQNPFLPPVWVPTPGNLRFRRAMIILHRLIDGLIAQRRQGGMRRGDLLDLLLEARDPESGEGMDEALIRDEALTVFAAGHETTAVALTWTWYLLGRHPEARARLQQELSDILGGRNPRVDDLPRLPFTRAVFEEALRLYPPAVGIMRRVTRDTHMEGCLLPRGSTVFVNIRNIHRHPGYWSDPHRFRPERFLDEAQKPAHRLAFMPFGAGPRVCVGNHLALTEASLMLALIAKAYDLEPVSQEPVEPALAVTQKPTAGLPLRLRRRAA